VVLVMQTVVARVRITLDMAHPTRLGEWILKRDKTLMLVVHQALAPAFCGFHGLWLHLTHHTIAGAWKQARMAYCADFL
jgi:hypothetical protein